MSAQADRALSLGAEVNGHPERVEGVLDDLEAMLAAPEDAEAALAAIDALGHAWDPRAVRLLLDLVDSADTDLRVREALVRALPCGADDSSVRDDVTDVLIRMSADDAPTVRSWSCFGLGQLNADSGPAVSALAARLVDMTSTPGRKRSLRWQQLATIAPCRRVSTSSTPIPTRSLCSLFRRQVN